MAEVPGMYDGHLQGDMAHPHAAPFLFDNLYIAAVASEALVAGAFVFAAGALIVSYRPKYLLTEKPQGLGFVGFIVNRFGTFDFAPAPL
jgi:hypothetical protein